MNRLPLRDFDPEIYAAISNEVRRQEEGLELIAMLRERYDRQQDTEE